jgi:hypothetical protein
MKQTMRMKKKWLGLFMTLVILITTLSPVWAAEQPTMDVSKWAITTLNEGEKYGIYPVEWYYDAFKSEISSERLETLIEGVDAKLATVGKKVDFKALDTAGDRTREDVLIRLYNLLGSYGLVEGDDAIAYMQSKGIVNGTNNGIELKLACNSEQAVVLAIHTVQAAFDKMDAGAKGMFWKVEKNNNTVYLLGSVHVGNTSMYPLDNDITDAFNLSDMLLVEADMINSAAGVEYYMSKAVYNDGTTIKNHISTELYANLLTVFEKYNLDPALYTTFKPWVLANELNVFSMTSSETADEKAKSASLGIDMSLTINAYLSQKPVVELEGIPYQTDLFDSLTQEYQEEFLGSTIENILNPGDGEISEDAQLLTKWLGYWISGDLTDFKESFAAKSSSEDSELTSMLYGKRDVDMTDKIQQLLDQEGKATYFVVVGSGHFINDNSIVDLLTERGYNVEWMY